MSPPSSELATTHSQEVDAMIRKWFLIFAIGAGVFIGAGIMWLL